MGAEKSRLPATRDAVATRQSVEEATSTLRQSRRELAPPDQDIGAASGLPTSADVQLIVPELLARERELPRGVGALQEHWRELPLAITANQVLKAGWLGDLSRAPLYRAMGRSELPVVKLGRRTLILTMPLLRMLGIDFDRPAVCVTAGQASSQACSPPGVHDVDGGDTP
jgi:hypothetical protein